MGDMSEKSASPPNVTQKPAEPAPVAAPDGPPPHGGKLEERALPPEIGGPTGPEPTRYGDWERKGRVSDF